MDIPQIIAMTPEMLKAFAGEIVAAVKEEAAKEQTTEPTQGAGHFVYGLRGIRNLFNVSHVTAQKYKKTFLAPAIMQRGRKIVVDVDKAIELYKANQPEQQTEAAANRHSA